jgi:succinate dehydrogenase/fumarate reductase flavoprotein subunit
MELSTDVLVIGAGAAGMYAGLAAAARGASVLLVDKSLVARGGATVMAQMTVAAALGHQSPDSPERHFADTLAAGRGVCEEPLTRLLAEEAPARILELDGWNVGWARENDHIRQVGAPGHSVPRCVYVDFLNTGPAVARTLHTQVNRCANLRRVSNLYITELLVAAGLVCGAMAFDVESGSPVTISAQAVILATGGLTKLYRRNSASANMSGDGYSLALRAGAELVDMEFVQFFPIGHLAPRLVGMDPIMWDPFRYKLGGRLLNGHFEEFVERWGGTDGGTYTAPRDLATYAILMESEAGRGSPAGGAYLSFQHVSEAELRQAFGPIIDRLARNGIDLTRMPVEVAPIAHYHMGGVKVDSCMRSTMPGLYAAGESVGGTHGANRLSGNALTEAFVFGHRAGVQAAAFASQSDPRIPAAVASDALREQQARLRKAGRSDLPSPAALISALQTEMWAGAGPFRTQSKLTRTLARIQEYQAMLSDLPLAGERVFLQSLADWYDLRALLDSAECLTRAALERKESRGAHQREDYPATASEFRGHYRISRRGAGVALAWHPQQTGIARKSA